MPAKRTQTNDYKNYPLANLDIAQPSGGPHCNLAGLFGLVLCHLGSAPGQRLGNGTPDDGSSVARLDDPRMASG